MSLARGTRLGPYEIVEQIGAGGMGEVYKAKDTRLNRTVAIKVLPSRLADNPDLKQRFEREARAVSSLNHPHICTLHDVGEENGTAFLVMEYIEGETLADRLKKGALSLDRALRLATQIADALDKAHRHGVVHRDLKPGNVMVTQEGAKLLDFGLAKLRTDVSAETSSRLRQGYGGAEPALSALPTEEKPLTEKGTILGTFQYMAPEQLEGKDADARTDLFAFGALLFEMLTGRKAFEGKSQASLISAIMSSNPRPVSELQPMSPPVLERIVTRCLEKDPEERWQTAKDLASELEWVGESRHQSGSGTEQTGPHRNRETWAWGIALLATFALLYLALTPGNRGPTNDDLTQFLVNPPELTAFASWRLGEPVISPDGRVVAFIGKEKSGERAWVRSFNSLDARPLKGTEGAGTLFWSPDNRFLGFHSYEDGKLRKIDIEGGPPQTICETAAPLNGATWNEDNVILYATLWSSVRRVSSAGGPSSALTKLDPSRHEIGHLYPQFLPDGNHFLFYVRSREAEYRGTYVSSLDAPDTKRLVLGGAMAGYASPGYLLFAREGTLLAQRFNVGRLELVGEPTPIAERVTLFNHRGFFSTSNNGVLAYKMPTTPDHQLTWFDRHGNELGALPVPEGSQNPELSPDSNQLAFERRDPKTGTRDVWLYELSRGITSRFTFDPSDDSDPVWSPDGNHIVFSSGRLGYQNLYRKDVSSSLEAELIHETEGEVWPMGWSPDGQHVIQNRWSSDTTTGRLWLLPMSGDRQAAPLLGTDFEEIQGQFSPNGKWISYTSNESGRHEVYVQPFPAAGAKRRISTEGGTDGRWRGDGREIFYITPDNTLMSVELSFDKDSIQPSAPRPLFRSPIGGQRGVGIRFNYAVSSDGKRFLIDTQLEQSGSSPIVVVLNWTQGLEK